MKNRCAVVSDQYGSLKDMNDEQTCMETDAELKGNAWQMSDFKVAALMEQIKCHCSYLLGMVGSWIWKPTYDPVKQKQF